MITDLIQPGDFAIIDSNKTPARIVKYLMRSPTIWHDLWRKFRGSLEKPLHYHAFMFLDKDTLIDQQGKVRIASSNKYLNSQNRLFIFRMKNGLSISQQNELLNYSKTHLGNWYGVMSCIAKTLTWLTGIKFFARYIHIPNTEICINLVCKWYHKILEEKFGKITYLESTTWSVYKYVKIHPEKFEIVFEGIPRNEI